jgi:hypothetical protein
MSYYELGSIVELMNRQRFWCDHIWLFQLGYVCAKFTIIANLNSVTTYPHKCILVNLRVPQYPISEKKGNNLNL